MKPVDLFSDEALFFSDLQTAWNALQLLRSRTYAQRSSEAKRLLDEADKALRLALDAMREEAK